MKIATMTVNPSIDTGTKADQVAADRKLRCDRAVREPGGGGINVSRAVHELGGESLALYTAGGPYGDMLRDLLKRDFDRHRAVKIKGWTREDITVGDRSSGQQYRFVMSGPELDEEEWRRCIDEIDTLEPPPEFLVASGSLPPGVPQDFYARVTERAGNRGIKTIVDTSGEPLNKAVQAGVYLLKPNIREMKVLLDTDENPETRLEELGGRLIDMCDCEVIVISLGSAGVLLVTDGICERINAPTVPISSKIGAGDSTVAGIVLGLVRGKDISEAVRFGVAAGAAAVMTPGTELCRREDTEKLYRRILSTEKRSSGQ